MSAEKMSISLPPDLGEGARESTRRSGKSVSSWLREAAAAKLRAEALARFLREWEAEHGALAPEEIARADAELGLRRSASSAWARLSLRDIMRLASAAGRNVAIVPCQPHLVSTNSARRIAQGALRSP